MSETVENLVDRDRAMTVLRELLEELDIDEAMLLGDSRLRRDLELDSTETVQIGLEVKRRLHVEITLPRSDLTLDQVCELIVDAASIGQR
jgi:acyl carrier protein